MFYFENNGKYIEKYNLSYNKETIKKIRNEIICNCSKIVHKNIESTVPIIIMSEDEKVKNLHYKKLGYIEFRDGTFHENYKYDYDEYCFPKIIDFIDRLLCNDLEALNGIFNYNESDIQIGDEEINKISNEIDNINNLNVDEKIEKLNELKRLINSNQSNNSKLLNKYINELKENINIQLIDKYPISEVERINKFLSTEYDVDVMDDKEVLVLKRGRNI